MVSRNSPFCSEVITGLIPLSTSADLAPDAFEGARGLFLVNQAAGNNNATANTFTLSASP